MGRNIQYIKLLPTATSEEVKYLLLGIDVDRLQVYRLIEVGLNRTLTTLTLKVKNSISLYQKIILNLTQQNTLIITSTNSENN